MAGKSFESEAGKESFWESSQISVPFGPLGLTDNIPSSVFEVPDGRVANFEGCEEVLALLDEMYDEANVVGPEEPL